MSIDYDSGMNARLSVVCAALLASLVWTADTHAQDEAPPVNLQPKFKAGQVSRYEVWTRRVLQETVSGNGRERSASRTIEITGEVTWRVEDVSNDGSARCVLTMDWMVGKLILPDGTEQVNDSRLGSGDTPALHKFAQAIAGTPITCQVNADGTIASTSGFDAIKDKLDEGVDAPGEEDWIETASDLATLPGAVVDAAVGGDRWSHTHKMPHQMGKITAPVNYQLDSVEDIAGVRIANVSGKATLSFEPELPDLPPDGPKVELRMTEGTLQTQIMFDLWRNEAVGRNTVQNQTFELNLSIQGQTMTRRMTESVHAQVLRIEER